MPLLTTFTVVKSVLLSTLSSRPSSASAVSCATLFSTSPSSSSSWSCSSPRLSSATSAFSMTPSSHCTARTSCTSCSPATGTTTTPLAPRLVAVCPTRLPRLLVEELPRLLAALAGRCSLSRCHERTTIIEDDSYFFATHFS